MSELRELYQSTILDHSKRPRNFRKPESANLSARGFNPLCGDKVAVFLRVRDDAIEDVGFEGSGCAISTASASMMTEIVKGKSRAEVERLFQQFHALVTAEHGKTPETDALGKLKVFAGVHEFPMRVKCATLVWHALLAALAGREETVKTE
jgi:nitrogen fixation NifU-like protein